MTSTARRAIYPAYKRPPAGGYRKTARKVVHRTPTHEAPNLELAFILPNTLPFRLVPIGVYPFVTVGPLYNAVAIAKTFNREQVLEHAAGFLREAAGAGHPPFTVAAVLTSSSDPGWKARWELAYVDGSVVACLSPITPIIFPKDA